MPKVLIIVLVAIVMLFVVTLGLNAGRPSGQVDPDDPPAVVEMFDGAAGGNFLEVTGDVTSDCDHSATQLTLSGSCSVVVPSRGRFSKPLRVVAKPTSGSFTAAVQPNGGDRYDSDGQVPRDGAPCFETAIDHHGATIALSCASAGGGSACQVDLLKNEC